MLMDCELSRISETPKDPHESLAVNSSVDKVSRYLKKIEGASKVQRYLLRVVLPTTNDKAKQQVIYDDLDKLSAYIRSCSKECQSSIAASYTEEKCDTENSHMYTPDRHSSSNAASTPGSFDRLLCKLMSPATPRKSTRGSTAVSNDKELGIPCTTGVSVYTPQTPPRSSGKSVYVPQDYETEQFFEKSHDCAAPKATLTDAPANRTCTRGTTEPHSLVDTNEVSQAVQSATSEVAVEENSLKRDNTLDRTSESTSATIGTDSKADTTKFVVATEPDTSKAVNANNTLNCVGVAATSSASDTDSNVEAATHGTQTPERKRITFRLSTQSISPYHSDDSESLSSPSSPPPPPPPISPEPDSELQHESGVYLSNNYTASTASPSNELCNIDQAWRSPPNSMQNVSIERNVSSDINLHPEDLYLTVKEDDNISTSICNQSYISPPSPYSFGPNYSPPSSPPMSHDTVIKSPSTSSGASSTSENMVGTHVQHNPSNMFGKPSSAVVVRPMPLSSQSLRPNQTGTNHRRGPTIPGISPTARHIRQPRGVGSSIPPNKLNLRQSWQLAQTGNSTTVETNRMSSASKE
eukprot:CAMPEP_0185035156 /NCGR_PEP_ID=MMETSP1103-20130426/25974_1 /TAXON_ID=36769 /ORGANISM="Paraphysomonas bandaiensis, Strain Caron Lab Isolate" /LENGTH=580 /DNA_ID=CAMNT_0027572103 /DNA_START=178 /DNA_END=1920 /DNA_ORIENTATION=+